MITNASRSSPQRPVGAGGLLNRNCALSKRATRAARAVEWLSDNGPPYTGKETRDFATQLNLAPCFTPVASPESHGLAEAFVRTFKHDYARLVALPGY